MKRTNYISWDDYFMSIAMLSSLRSKDPSTQVGACLVSNDNKVIGIGYNGMPRGCDDDVFPWCREADDINDTKYPYVVHAEVNAIMNSSLALKDSRIFVTLFPCNECCKMIIQSGVSEVVYLTKIVSEKFIKSILATERMLESARIKTTKFIPTNNILLDFLSKT